MPSCQVAVVLGMAVSLVDGARTQMGQGTWPGLWGPTATASLCIDCGDPYTLGGLIVARWPCPVRSCSSLIPCRVVKSWRSFIEGVHGAEHGAGGDSSGAIVRYDLNVCFVSSAAHPCAVRYQLPSLLVGLSISRVGIPTVLRLGNSSFPKTPFYTTFRSMSSKILCDVKEDPHRYLSLERHHCFAGQRRMDWSRTWQSVATRRG